VTEDFLKDTNASDGQKILQKGVSINSIHCELIVSFMTGDWLWFIGALIMQFIGPYTIFVLMPCSARMYSIKVLLPSTVSIATDESDCQLAIDYVV